MQRIISFLFFIITTGLLSAQNVTISGYIKDSTTRETIGKAQIIATPLKTTTSPSDTKVSPDFRAATNGYVLADRGTWLNFRNRGELAVLVEGDARLFNQYGVMAINPARHPHVKAADARRFVDWIVSPAGQASIAAYRIGGEQLFFPNADG